MGKQNDIVYGVNQGLDLALRIVEKEGIEELRKTIEYRNISGCSLNVSRKDIEAASERMKYHSTITAIAISLEVLRNDFYFSNYQMQKFDELFGKRIQECCDNPSLIKKYMENAEEVGVIIDFKEDK